MTKRCTITKKVPLVGNNVSHAINKTKRRFLPNLQNVSFYSEILGKKVKLKVSTRGIKSVENKGGIDSYVLNIKNNRHTAETKKLKKLFSSKQQSSSKSS
tara:strand:- start:147 stop:446 length:300 start_codon:yes stop_codon:yes gene_type:complete